MDAYPRSEDHMTIITEDSCKPPKMFDWEYYFESIHLLAINKSSRKCIIP